LVSFGLLDVTTWFWCLLPWLKTSVCLVPSLPGRLLQDRMDRTVPHFDTLTSNAGRLGAAGSINA